MSMTTQGMRRGRWFVVLLAVWALGLQVLSANAAVDLLDLPAMKSAKPGQALLLTAAHAGKRLVVAGERGIILYSDDDGSHWTQAEVPVSVTLTALQFINSNDGWAVGHDGIVLHTGDSGRTWNKQVDGYRLNQIARQGAEQQVQQATAMLASATDSDAAQLRLDQAQFLLDDVTAGSEFGPSRPLLGVWFSNAHDGLVVGANGQAFITHDGGLNWASAARQLNNPEALHYNAIVADAKGDLLIAGEAGKVYRATPDGSWHTLDSGYGGALYGILPFEDANGAEMLLAYGFGGAILRSADLGATWSRIDLKDKLATLVGALRLDGGTILLLAQDGTLLRSDDLGLSFISQRAVASMRVASMVDVADGQAVLMAGLGGLHRVGLGAGKTESGDITK
ncbi:WD40/YVTN/BNR-like repeat-containing protein [Pseudomonas moorei]|uniref:WD40/YVTN/BNR-like repeat-containing protein n=1 Tax=Pseudomonas moorei TaxID=395599 RepID=UPI001FF59EBF|nr:YCF48-related protein [Pseudomonas moorei]